MKPIGGKAMRKVLERRGWICSRSRGSHFYYRHPDFPGVLIPVPVHRNDDLKPGTQRDIMKHAGLTDDDL